MTVSHFWLTPLPPLAAFALLAVLAGLRRRVAIGLALGGVAVSCILSMATLPGAGQAMAAGVSADWLDVGGRPFALALRLDPLGAVTAALVSVIALVVFVYAATYMAADPHVRRFFALMSLFIGAMLTLVLAADLITLFIAWEIVGACSALLIGFWGARPGAGAAATKAFIVTRFGDVALLLAVLLIVQKVGNARIYEALGAATAGAISPSYVAGVGFLALIGAATKSAQVPFQGWLPDAMVGPTPVSALLHSATMVAAGVFLIARLYPLFEASPSVMATITWVGALTALLGGAAALVEEDLKRALAYSTMSQLGLMFVGLGAGSLVAGMLLLIAQAIYKASLFLTAGVIEHAVGGTDFARMGGLRRRLPWTFVAAAISAAALAGLPVTPAAPPKDVVLTAAWTYNTALFGVVLAASVLTAMYSARIIGLVFLGTPTTAGISERRGGVTGLLLPALALTALVSLGLLINADIAGRPLERLLGVSTATVPATTAIAVVVAVVGVAAGLWARHRWPAAVVWPPLRSLAPLLWREFGLRDGYAWGAAVASRLAHTMASTDRRLFDPVADRVAAQALGIIRGAAGFDRAVFDAISARATRLALRAIVAAEHFDRAVFDAISARATQFTLRAIIAAGRFDVRRIDAFVTSVGARVLTVSERLRPLQTGRIENYLVPLFVWGVLLVALAALLARAA